MSTPETYGPALGARLIINAPGLPWHGKTGTVVALDLGADEATVQVIGGVRHTIPLDPRSKRPLHGTRPRYQAGCHCIDCTAAEAAYSKVAHARLRKQRRDERAALEGERVAEVARQRRAEIAAAWRDGFIASHNMDVGNGMNFSAPVSEYLLADIEAWNPHTGTGTTDPYAFED